MASAGFPVEGVDTVVMSHLDGVGMAARMGGDGSWTPLFANARVVLSRREVDYVRAHSEVSGSRAPGSH
jgi:hypothetical protein